MQKIKTLVMDVGGTLTDGKIYMPNRGEMMKAFNIKDGYAIARLADFDILPVIITGRESDIVLNRCKELKITNIYQRIESKIFKLRNACAEKGVSLNEVAYIDDDLKDVDCMNLCGFTAAPADAMHKVKDVANYVCNAKGGEGAAREYIDYLTSLGA